MPLPQSRDDDFQSDALQTTARSGRHLSQQSSDHKRTYQKWKRATFIIYGAVATILVILSIAIGPTESASTSKSEMLSSLAPAAGRTR